MIADKDLLSIQQARILAENAFCAQSKLAAFPQEKLDGILEHIVRAVEPHLQALAVMEQEETHYGRHDDKWTVTRFLCSALPDAIRPLRCVGVLDRNPAAGTLDIGVPLGVIAALCPVTSPVAAAICKTLLAVKSGNAIIFSPHPRALASMGRVLDIMIEAAESHGLPKGCLSYLKTVTASGTRELMRHSAVSLLLVTGVPGMLPEAESAGKPLIYGGAGNGPAFVERSANIPQAVSDIIRSKSFDHGIAPAAEHSLVVDACIDARVRAELLRHGAFIMSDEESLRLAGFFFSPDGRRKKDAIGVPAGVLARRAGIAVPDQTLVLVAPRRYVSESDPYARELLAPVLAYYVEDDWRQACEKCLELLMHERNAHTLAIHSADEEVIMQFALKKPVARLLVNTPAALGALGMTTGLFPAITLGSGCTGAGITSDNLSPLHLVYIRKVGYGARSATKERGPASAGNAAAEGTQALEKVLRAALQAMQRQK